MQSDTLEQAQIFMHSFRALRVSTVLGHRSLLHFFVGFVMRHISMEPCQVVAPAFAEAA